MPLVDRKINNKDMQMKASEDNSNSNSKDKKRLDSTIKYIDNLSEKHSKLTIVRVDLGYRKLHSNDLNIEDANKDVEHLLNNMRTKPSIFKHKVGHVIKKEQTDDKGVHVHAMFIYDGQKVQKDAFKGDQIGQYWEQKITDGKGSYHNCNRNEYDRKGIGMLDHRDKEKRKILDEDVIAYLCKDEQEIKQIKGHKQVKAFTRGVIQKKKDNMGRPRE